MANTAAKGARFERVVKTDMERHGWYVIRTPASSWTTGHPDRPVRPKADLLAVHPSGLVAYVQAKAVKVEKPWTALTTTEWEILWAVAELSPHWIAVVAVAGRTYGDVRYETLTGPKVAHSRSQRVLAWSPVVPDRAVKLNLDITPSPEPRPGVRTDLTQEAFDLGKHLFGGI
jgi:hypothetical protein